MAGSDSYECEYCMVPQVCTRTHKCAVDGPRNGTPRVWTDVDAFGDWAETMWFSGGQTATDRSMGERDIAIAGLGIGGEWGELVEHGTAAVGKVLEKIKKEIRDHTPARELILKELGDVVFYVFTIGRYFGYKPSDILRANYEKLMSRRERGTERGSGDNR